jgi:formylglycine-generating enzyme required for sulfatase activity
MDEPPANAAGADPAPAPSPAPPPATATTPGTAPTSGTAPTPSTASPCSGEMLLIDGEHCSDVEQVCLKWIDPPPYQNLRCAEYAKPTKCKVAKVHKRFCIDREEYTDGRTKNEAGEDLPVVRKSWVEAKAICEARGARLCKEAEWELACEGPDISPYPYGWKRDSTVCNFDRTDLGGAEEKLTDHRAPLSAFPQCVSPYGVHDMVGNVDEWTEREGMAAPNRSSLRGGWWLPGRNRCRAATTHHDESYGGKQVGFRCCKDA